jgi:hypothetical protein
MGLIADIAIPDLPTGEATVVAPHLENRCAPACRRQRFHFANGRTFDFRGGPERTLNRRSRTLADSSERASKGFVPTYAFARDYGGLVGRFKLDWFFVKPFIEDPRVGEQSWLFAPKFPETMLALNESVEGRISGHPPLTVDLRPGEPVADRR